MLEDRSYMREPEWRPEASRSGISLCLTLILINVACYILQHTVRGFEETLALFPQRLQNGNVWELLSYQFLHGGLFHLLINCAMIWFAGRQIEEALGKAKFLALYLVAGVFGGLLQCALSWSGFLPPAGVVGASAGIFGLIAAFAMVYWERELTFLIMFVIPVRMKAKYLLIALAVIGVLGIISKEGGIAHGAHLGGMIWGVLFILLFIQGSTYSDAEPWWDQLRNRFSSGDRRKVVTINGGARAYSRDQDKAEEADDIDFVESEVDPILDKISEKGIQSLTERERKILEQARKKMRR
jgi:membrane associated rhomboid family serine protease|tara:strand:+ start:1033 stop:1926 length:894 start_codon:yes stop_codon:yes gene_type:complete